MSLNRVILVGRLTRDPDLRYTPNGTAVANFTIAINRPFKNKETGAGMICHFRRINMKTHDINTQRMMAHYVQQLNELGFYDTNGMDYPALKQKLTVERMKQINYDSPSEQYF